MLKRLSTTAAAKETIFVLGGTGRQGRATIDALVAKGATSIVATSRYPDSPAAKELLEIDGVTNVVKADMTDVNSVHDAIKESGASRVWFTTDFFSPYIKTRAKETLQGTNVIDAIVKVGSDQIKHVVYSSVGDADNCASNISHFWSKADVEKYMKENLTESKITFAIIRPVAFFDNLDDPKSFNALKKGKVKFFTKPEVSQSFVATIDVGKGSAMLLLYPSMYKGTPIEAVGGKHTGPELAEALKEVSGVDCVYTFLPRFALWTMSRDLYAMVQWFESDGYTGKIEEFKKLVPDAMDAKAWFKKKGQWANGESFSAE